MSPDENRATRKGRHHNGKDADDVHTLEGNWHVSVHWPDMFPATEASCPCRKAPCGLAVPLAEIPCEHHHGAQPIRQSHHVNDCTALLKPRILGIFGRRRIRE